MNTQRNINSAILPSIPEDSVWISILDFLYESYSARKFVSELFYEPYSTRKFSPEIIYKSYRICNIGGVCRGCSYF